MLVMTNLWTLVVVTKCAQTMSLPFSRWCFFYHFYHLSHRHPSYQPIVIMVITVIFVIQWTTDIPSTKRNTVIATKRTPTVAKHDGVLKSYEDLNDDNGYWCPALLKNMALFCETQSAFLGTSFAEHFLGLQADVGYRSQRPKQATLIADKGQENCQPQFVSDIFHPTHFSVCHPVLRICCPVCIFGPPWVLGVRNLEISRQRRPRNVKTSGLVKFQTIWWIKLRFRISNSLYDHFFSTWINFPGTNFLNLISSFAYFCNRCFWHLLRQREESWMKTGFQQIMVFPGKLPDGSSHACIQKIWDGIRSGFALHSFADNLPPAPWFWSHPSSEWNLFPSISLPLSATTSSKCFLARFKRPSTLLRDILDSAKKSDPSVL